MGKKKITLTKKTGVNGSVPELFSSLQLDEALRYAEEVFDRSCINFFLLGETAIQVKDFNKLDQLPEITLGLVESQWGGIQQRLFKTAMEFLEQKWQKNKDGFEFNHLGVPIRVKVIHKHRRFFGNLDNIVYDYGNYLIPNQFERYRKMKGMVQ